MKKKYVVFLSVLAMASATGAWAQTATLSLAVNNAQMGTVRLDDAAGRTIFGDVVKSFPATSGHQYGVCTDGTNIYTSSWSTSVEDGFLFHQYSANGDSLDAFSIPGVLPIRDLTSDGTNFYGGANGDTIYAFDFTQQTRVGAIQCQGMQIRHISYDAVRDGFWVGNWGTLSLYGRDGSKIQDGPSVSSISGTAWYKDVDEHLLLFAQPNSDALVFDYNITRDTLFADTVLDFSITDSVTGISGGSFIGNYNGRLCWFGDAQQSPNYIGIYPIVNVPTDSINKTVTAGTQLVAVATPKEGYCFVGWSDENTDNPRTFTVGTDTDVQAVFARENSGIDNRNADGISVYARDGRIVVEGAEGLTVNVYDMMGREVFNTSSTTCVTPSLPEGIYLVNVGMQPARKVVVIR